MSERPFKKPKRGGYKRGAQISLRELIRLQGQVEQLAKTAIGSKTLVHSNAGGTFQDVVIPRLVWGEILSGNNPYTWRQLKDNGSGVLSDDEFGLEGTATSLPAYEVNGSQSVPAGAIVRMLPSCDGDSYLFLYDSNPISYQDVTLNSDQHNYAPNRLTRWLRITPTSNIKITGLVLAGGNINGSYLEITNAASQASGWRIELPHLDSQSASANQFRHWDGKDVYLLPGETVKLKYDGSKWVSVERPSRLGILDVASLRLPQKIALLASASHDNYAGFKDQTGWLVQLVGDAVLTGLDASPTVGQNCDGQLVVLENTGLGDKLSLKHLDSGSLSNNQIVTPDTLTYDVLPGQSVLIKRDNLNNKWRILSPALPVWNTVQILRLPQGTITATGTQNNYSGFAQRTGWRCDGASDLVLTGIDHTAPTNQVTEGKLLLLENVSSTSKLVLKHEDAGSVSQSRILTPDGKDYLVQPGFSAWLKYDGTSQRWRVIAPPSVTQLVARQVSVYPGATEDNYAGFAGYTGARLTPASGGTTITGIQAAQDGALLLVENVGNNPLHITNEDLSSLAANRCLTPDGNKLTIPYQGLLLAKYDSTDSRWRVWPVGMAVTIPTSAPLSYKEGQVWTTSCNYAYYCSGNVHYLQKNVFTQTGDLVYCSSGGTPGTAARLPIGNSNAWLRSGGTTPTWSQTTLADNFNRGDLVRASASNTLNGLPIGGANTLLRSNGTDPDWGKINLLSGYHGDTTAGTVQRGDLITGQGSSATWTRLPVDTTATRYLANTGPGNEPKWDQINLTNGVTGVLSPGNGGTGGTLPVSYGGTGATTQAGAQSNLGVPSNTKTNLLCEGRLTLTSNTPVTTADVTNAGTLYFTPLGAGSGVALYDGSTWKTYTLSEISLSLTVTAGSLYDVFLYDSGGGTLALELSPAWSGLNTRSEALAKQDGVWVKGSDHTRRYIGTICASGTNQTEDSKAKRWVWNAYNRVPRVLLDKATTDYYSTTSTLWHAYCAESVVVEWVRGLNEEPVWLEARGNHYNIADNAYVGIGIDRFNGNDAALTTGCGNLGSAQLVLSSAMYLDCPSLGYHFAAMVEKCQSGIGATFYGDAGMPDNTLQAGLIGCVWG
jgi:hypothetical protein